MKTTLTFKRVWNWRIWLVGFSWGLLPGLSTQYIGFNLGPACLIIELIEKEDAK